MKRFFALASFALAVSFVFGASGDPEVVIADVNDGMTLSDDSMYGTVIRCTVETSEGKTYEFYPNNESPGSSQSYGSRCQYYLNEIEQADAGIWTVTTTTDFNRSYKKMFDVIVSRDVQVKPTNNIMANAGQWITVWFDGNDTEVTACRMQATVGSEDYDLLNDKIEGVRRYRGCGVQILATENMPRQWELSRKIGNHAMEKSILITNVPYKDEYNERVINYLWNLGKSAKIEIQRTGMVFCQLVRPDGSMTDKQYGNCNHKISSVTEFHRGTWRAIYAMMGKMELDQLEIHVQTWDLEALNGMQLPGTGPEINLLCRTGLRYLRYCSFIRPDKHTIYLPAGVGSNNYSYYGDGYDDKSDSRPYGDCGLTIHKPSAIDFGLWSCEMGIPTDDGIIIRGTVIDVVKTRAERTYRVNAPSVFVKREDEFKIRCTVNALLDYCWLTSPNGTIYSVLSKAASAATLEYDGKGFAMGDCGAIVKRANVSDDGDWTCHLGISGGSEVEKKIPVQVTDSYLIPIEKKVYGSDKTKLSCRTFLEEEASVKYCRWVRPDGHGINQKDAWRYETNREKDRCEITIRAITPEDIGQWTCVAMLTGAIKTEQWATMDLKSIHYELTTTSLVSIVLGSGLLIIVLVGSFMAAMYVFKRRKIQGEIKSPPPYDPEDYDIPRVIQTGSNEPTMDKDYKY